MSEDLTGQRFNRWVVKKIDKSITKPGIHYVCKCDCGAIKTVVGYSLKSGNSKSCGCLRKEVTSNRMKLDLTGKRFGRFTVIKQSSRAKDKRNRTRWICQCECGTEKVVRTEDLQSGNTKSCGCLQRESMEDRAIDLSGKRFGRLVPVKLVSHNPVIWECQCDCGTMFKVRASSLGRNTKSCGCLKRETAGNQARTHGRSKSKEYRAWLACRGRCNNKNNHKYSEYGGRGIYVDPRWNDDFETFFADMGEAPSPDHSLERIDVDGPYSPENCRWATYEDQMKNRRLNLTGWDLLQMGLITQEQYDNGRKKKGLL